MNWEALAAVAELIGALGFIITIAYLAVQIRQNNRLIASSLAESTRDALNETTRILASDREAARVYWAGMDDRSSLTDQERQQFDALLTLTFFGQQQAFVQGQFEETSDFRWTLGFPGVRDWWATYSPVFPGAFQWSSCSRSGRPPPNKGIGADRPLGTPRYAMPPKRGSGRSA